MNNIEIYENALKLKNEDIKNCNGFISKGTACCKCYRCINEIEDLWNKYKYYQSDLECYSTYLKGDRACSLCSSVKSHIFDNCKNDTFMWANIYEYIKNEKVDDKIDIKFYIISGVCPKCRDKTKTFRHPFAKVWCDSCDFVLREEGEKLV